MEDQLDPLYLALLNFRINKIDEAHKHCNRILERNPLDQAAWSLKLACFTEEVFVDELENDEAGIVDAFMDDNVIATAARPGTSFSRPLTSSNSSKGGPSPAMRPRTQTGRPLSGMVRPESRLKTGTMEQTLRTSRLSSTARPVSSSTARLARLGTASMMAQAEGLPFLNLARLNVEKYAADKTVARYLFEYVFLHETDMKTAHQIAAAATKSAEFNDWYWKNQLGKCYYRLGLLRDAEKQFNSSLKNCKTVETYGYLAKVYRKLDQPLSSIDHLNEGLRQFPDDLTLLTLLARVYEDIGDLDQSITQYKRVLQQDASNVEGIACIGTNYFYRSQPEIALKFYRRILQMGVTSSELYLNIALCCFYCQQFDLAIGCLEQAHAIADDSVQADLWYDSAHIAIANCDLPMAERCLRIALATDPDHAESLCNLGVLKMQENKMDEARHLFHSATLKGPHLYEAHFNLALLLHEVGNYASCYESLKKSLELFPEHFYSKKLLMRVETILSS
ncbi:tetratricopeptide repeat protein 8 [Ditylenchus destructor]|uniref:Tetratricopeptide repeat protein 8 n=1 Tax=Ditylenchus destructor TaxID=166010 RepID=A0AAD4N429_9BILA|nr:tetratricopeptide repeat protein 8 [Ditylenchus destructor]